jgi:hypothetical protein
VREESAESGCPNENILPGHQPAAPWLGPPGNLQDVWLLDLQHVWSLFGALSLGDLQDVWCSGHGDI